MLRQRPAFIFNIAILFTCLLLSGCVLLDLRDDLKQFTKASSFSGTVESNTSEDDPILIALYEPVESTFRLKTFNVRYGTGEFELLVDNGKYYLIAFEDKNQDFTWQTNEYIGWYGLPSLMEATTDKNFNNIKLSLRSPEQAKQELPILFSPTTPRNPLKITQSQIGIVTDLKDKRFDAEIGKLGMWQPFKFVQEKNHGIFFLEPYDPNKIPILFVHGLTGAGGDWRTVVKHIDREKYQPWIMQYPSGLGLSLVGRKASEGITKLKLRYKFDELYVVAHSVGGLVARSMINYNLAQSRDSNVVKFIAVSTPWSGHVAARAGAENAPVVAPSWYDLVPNSSFIKSLTKEPLPEQIDFSLLFSHRATRLIDNAIHKSNSDGSVTIRSQLPLNLQKQANFVMGFDESHKTVLKSKAMIKVLNELLDQTHNKAQDSSILIAE